MGNLLTHAERELKAAGFDKKGDDGLYDGMLYDGALELVNAFAEQGHSGMSASMMADVVDKLFRFKPLTPLQGADDEWNEAGEGIWQNNRCSHVFKGADGSAYDINGKVFREPSGACYTSGESRVPVTFSYTPSTEYVDVPAETTEA